jgi:hypothetical protein
MQKATFTRMVTARVIVVELRRSKIQWPASKESFKFISEGSSTWCKFTGVIGHYHSINAAREDYGANDVLRTQERVRIPCEAICDHKCRFTFVDCSNCAWLMRNQGDVHVQGGARRLDRAAADTDYFHLGDNAYSMPFDDTGGRGSRLKVPQLIATTMPLRLHVAR